MKKLYSTILLLVAIVFFSNSQSLIPTPNDSAEITAVVTDPFDPYDVHIEVVNNSNGAILINWGLSSFVAPNDWELKLCDNNNCYDLLINPGPFTSLSVAPHDTMDMKFQFTSHCNAGSGSANVYAYVMGDSANSVIFLNYKANLSSNCASGIGETPMAHLSVSPNPVKSTFAVYDLENAGNLSFQVYDMKGAAVISEIKSATTSSIEISVEKLPAGLYVLKAFDKQGRLAGISRLSKVD